MTLFVTAIVQVLLDYDPELSKTIGPSNATPLVSAASRGHTAVVIELLSKDCGLLEIAKSNGKNALHLAARQGHVDIVEALLEKDPQLARRTDKKGQTALHMAVKGVSCEVVKLLLNADAAIVMLPDKQGNTALHVATRKKRAEVCLVFVSFVHDVNLCQLLMMYHIHTWKIFLLDIAMFEMNFNFLLPLLAVNAVYLILFRDCISIYLVSLGCMLCSMEDARFMPLDPSTVTVPCIFIVNELLRLPDANVNALNRDHKTSLDIAEDLSHSEEASEIKDCLIRYGAIKANELNQPRDELRNTVTQIKRDVHTQLEQTRRTNKNVHNISKELRKLHREGINNATNSVTVVAVLFATVAFAAIFTVPGGDNPDGTGVVVKSASFKIFFIFNALALFTSLAVVVVQITLVRGETKAERNVVVVINKLMWLASVCTSVAFIAPLI
ncbi:Ankyrin repeat-containing protein ITN1 [Vitis vinifera]|uniref:Ankyrin repeat-containing protein ITN1 n=1 Tax=Vitis vinifera TaxID=29760 RepID=A0A438EP33_VITVI|nr:Ankyrin repeat-containing protein ITN1 [Vitis vinifera]